MVLDTGQSDLTYNIGMVIIYGTIHLRQGTQQTPTGSLFILMKA